MKSTETLRELQQVATVKALTTIFESIASLHIAQVKDRVTSSQEYFRELWNIYTQLRVDPDTQIGLRAEQAQGAKPNGYLVLTSDGGLSGDIDERIVRLVLQQYDPATTDLIVIGAHGALLFAQQGIQPTYYFRLPPADRLIDVSPITAILLRYAKPAAFYQHYRSLIVQEVARIDLLAHVQTLARARKETNAEIISARDYVFEPDVEAVSRYLESVMLGIATNQLILESRLAQYASRFTAMSLANDTAGKLSTEISHRYNRLKRVEADERAKETVNALVAGI